MADAKQVKTPVEDFCNGSSQTRVVLAKPRLGAFGSSGSGSSSNKTSNPFGSVLRPPQLKAGSNPFTKVADISQGDTEKDKESGSSVDDRLKENKEADTETPKFVPLGSANVTPRTTNPVPAPPSQTNNASSSSGFVFGQNLSERVIMNEKVNNGDVITEHSSSNGTNELLFTSAAASVKDNGQAESSSNDQPSSGEGLAAAAAEYERSHARPPPATSNVTTTGEEDEINVMQISCRLFAWEAGGWRERGRGVVRLNDGAEGSARLVARQAGSLRLLMNTKLWSDMVVERPAAKSLRITACDAQRQVKLFLIMGAPGDIAQLNRALLTRITILKKNNCSQATARKAAERLEATTSDDFADVKDNPDPNDDYDSPSVSDRLDDKTEEDTLDTSTEDTEGKPLKRKEPADDEETPPKRPCPEV